ncbi:MAG: M42 family peptidase [Clostridia bacterium]|nr:M42 family peptidase [Clostridia bacterium]
MLDYKLLERLCTADGISGQEDEVRNIILEEISSFADDIKTDNSGNIIVFKKGKKTPSKKMLISAHMDEVGFIVTYINSDGTLKFEAVGGVNDSAAFANNVTIGKNKIKGVVCSKPVHLLKADEKKKYPPVSSLCIDIGAKDREEAEKYVSLGDMVAFDSPYENKNGRIISKAIDDRFGCLVLIELIKSELEYDMYFSFVVQEEVGLRGSKTAAFTVAPDCAIVIEATTASDVPFAENEKRVCNVGNGAVITFMDRATIYDREYYNIGMECAKTLGVKAQTKTMIAGGNDAGAIHCSRGGVRTMAVSVPCRYIHSSSSLASIEDMEAVYSVVKASAEKILGL